MSQEFKAGLKNCNDIVNQQKMEWSDWENVKIKNYKYYYGEPQNNYNDDISITSSMVSSVPAFPS